MSERTWDDTLEDDKAQDAVLNSLERQPYQSVKHLCLNTGVSAEDVLRVLDEAGGIEQRQVGSITAYFLEESRPDGGRLVLNADGHARFDFVPDEPKPLAEREGSARAHLLKNKAVLEQLMLEGKTGRQIADAFGLKLGTLWYEVGNCDELRALRESVKAVKAQRKEAGVRRERPAKAAVAEPAAPAPVAADSELPAQLPAQTAADLPHTAAAFGSDARAVWIDFAGGRIGLVLDLDLWAMSETQIVDVSRALSYLKRLGGQQ